MDDGSWVMADGRTPEQQVMGDPPCLSHQPLAISHPSTVSHFWLSGGYTFIELLVVSAIVMILASAVMPLVKVAATRQREAELRHALREMRTAIDKYKDAADTMQIGPLEIKVGSEGYPPDLETLVEGVAANNDATGRKLKFLRKVPVDPMTHSMDWGLRSYQDRPDSTRWGGQNVFDVYTMFDATALDGTKYKDW
jgi:general secretion pathway protein G